MKLIIIKEDFLGVCNWQPRGRAVDGGPSGAVSLHVEDTAHAGLSLQTKLPRGKRAFSPGL